MKRFCRHLFSQHFFCTKLCVSEKFSLPFTGRLLQSRKFVTVNMAAPEWQVAKSRILALSLEEKRKLYKADFIPLNDIPTWYAYATDKKEQLQDRKPNQEDINKFRHVNVDEGKNKKLANKVSICQMDITKLEVDAIVNAANSLLKAGGGVDGAIHRSAGVLLQDECNTLHGCPVGQAKVTGGYNLPAKYVIHTVGPQDKSEPNLQSCYDDSYARVKELNLKSVAYPCISTGIYGFPNRLAAHIALKVTRKFLENNEDFERVIFCTFMPVDLEIYETLMHLYFPVD